MEAFVGKWVGNGADRTGVDEYLAATKQTARKVKMMGKFWHEISIKGDSVTFVNIYEGHDPVTVDLKVGQATVVEVPEIGKMSISLTFENNAFTTNMEVHGVTFTNKTFLDGGVMIVESTAADKTMTSRLTKV